MNLTDKELRAAIFRELDATMARVCEAHADVPAQRTLAIGMAYFADMMSRHFGHAVTTEFLIAMAEHGHTMATEETTATRN